MAIAVTDRNLKVNVNRLAAVRMVGTIVRVAPERDVRDSARDVRPWWSACAAVRLAVGWNKASASGRQGQRL